MAMAHEGPPGNGCVLVSIHADHDSTPEFQAHWQAGNVISMTNNTQKQIGAIPSFWLVAGMSAGCVEGIIERSCRIRLQGERGIDRFSH